jgi:pimeloyl-ACP methyl ester carboxylesterase
MHELRVSRLEPSCPLLLVHPGADSWTPTAMSRPAFDRVLGDKRLRELSNGSHLPAERPARLELEQEMRDFLAAVERKDLARSQKISRAPMIPAETLITDSP